MRRLHPLTGLLRVLGHAVQGLSIPIFFSAMAGFVVEFDRIPIIELAALGLALGAGYGLASYLRFQYELTADSLDVNSGVLFYREREIPLERIQNVDVQRKLIHRLLGLAVVRVETAGGQTTEAELAFVSAAEATRLQGEIRTRRDTRRDRSADDGTTEPTTAEPAPAELQGNETPSSDAPTLLFSLTPRELAVYALTEFRPGAVLLAVIGYPLMSEYAGGLVLALARPLGGPASLTPSLTPDEALAVGAVAIPLTLVAGWLLGAVLGTIGYYDFSLGRRGGDFVYERGLLSRYSGAIPVDKLQTLTIRETALQRPLGYAGLQLETAGLGADRAEQGSPSAIPLAERHRVWSFAEALEGFDGPPTITRPPKRARRRYVVRYLLLVLALVAVTRGVATLVGDFQRWWLMLLAVPLVPIAAHLKWANRGYAVGPDHLFVRAGFWQRSTTVVPYDRLQTIERSRTLFQRRLDLADLVADTASSSSLFGQTPTVFDLPATDAWNRHEQLRTRLQEAVGAVSPGTAPE